MWATICREWSQQSDRPNQGNAMHGSDDRSIFDEQFVRCQRQIFRCIAALLPNRADAEEVFQETCIKVLQKWRDYDPSRPLAPWACGIARNMVRKWFDQSGRRGLPFSEVVTKAVSESQWKSSLAIDRRLEKLPECLDRLTAKQRRWLELCYSSGRSIKVLAGEEHVDPQVLYKRLERVRRILFEFIESALVEEQG
jgi:RNA polymerase sigma-70 factor, ECF subfamily